MQALEKFPQYSSRKGQASLEMIIISAAVIILVAMIAGYFLEVKDSTAAIAIAKKGLVEAMDEQGHFYIVEKIDFMQDITGKIFLNAKISPGFNAGDELDGAVCNVIAQEIIDNTKYTEVEINIINDTLPTSCTVS